MRCLAAKPKKRPSALVSLQRLQYQLGEAGSTLPAAVPVPAAISPPPPPLPSGWGRCRRAPRREASRNARPPPAKRGREDGGGQGAGCRWAGLGFGFLPSSPGLLWCARGSQGSPPSHPAASSCRWRLAAWAPGLGAAGEVSAGAWGSFGAALASYLCMSRPIKPYTYSIKYIFKNPSVWSIEIFVYFLPVTRLCPLPSPKMNK